MGTYECLLVERHGPVGWLINNRPAQLNAMLRLLDSEGLAAVGANANAESRAARLNDFDLAHIQARRDLYPRQPSVGEFVRRGRHQLLHLHVAIPFHRLWRPP